MAKIPGFNQSANMEKMFHDSSNFHSSVFPSILQGTSPKLTRNNYRDNCWFWRSQILFVVGAHESKDQLTDLIPCPEPLIASKNEISTELGEIRSRINYKISLIFTTHVNLWCAIGNLNIFWYTKTCIMKKNIIHLFHWLMP